MSSLECSFLVNLLVLGAGILFVDLELNDASKEIAMSISVGVAFIQFLDIICFHIYQQVNKISKKIPVIVKCCAFKYKNRQVSQEVNKDK